MFKKLFANKYTEHKNLQPLLALTLIYSQVCIVQCS